MKYSVSIRTTTETDTIPDINAVINYLQPLGLRVDTVEVHSDCWS